MGSVSYYSPRSEALRSLYYGSYYRGYGYGYGYNYYPYYRRCYPGFYLSFSFGYPYYSYPRAYCYPRYRYYCPPVYVAYPYCGYYYSYPYDYLYDYGYASCGFYAGFGIRFGVYRTSYFSVCSGFGAHAYDCHHHHVYTCADHGRHYYHVRDCSLCYPDGGVVYHDVDVPQAEAAIAVVESTDGAPPVGSSTLEEGAEVVEAPEPVSEEAAFFASLRPAQLSFALGVIDFQEGRYQDAAENLYNASIEDPDSKIVKVMLANALFAIGEYDYAALYLKLGLEDWEVFPRYEWTLRSFYRDPNDFETQRATLRREVELHPTDENARFVLAFVEFASGDIDAAAVSVDAILATAADPQTREITERIAREMEHRNGAFPRPLAPMDFIAKDDATSRFLASLSLGEVRNLEIQ